MQRGPPERASLLLASPTGLPAPCAPRPPRACPREGGFAAAL